jgi:hypothetical protein
MQAEPSTKWQPTEQTTRRMRAATARAIKALHPEPGERWPGERVGIRAPEYSEKPLSSEEVQVWLRTRSEVAA